MKKVSILSLIALIAIVISSCSSSNNVVSTHGISKRKYTKGFFFQRKSNLKTANTKVKDAELRDDKSLAKIEKSEEKKTKSKIAKRTTSIESSNRLYREPAQVNENLIVKEEISETRQFLSDEEDGINWSVTENQPSATGESIEEMPFENRDQSAKKEDKNSNGSDSDLIFVLAVVFAILIPPLGVAIYTNIDWTKVLITFLLTLLFFLPGMIYALLVVFDMI